MKQIVWTVLVLVLLILGAGLVFIYSGAYNIAASEPHSDIEEWLLETTMERSVEARAGSLALPDLTDSALIRSGFTHYDAVCVQCHGAPGIARHEFARGLNPSPPALTEAAEEFSPGEIFWIIKHGFKFTGMPSFGATHSDDQMQSIVAFVAALPAMTPAEYAAFREQAQTSTSSQSESDADGQEHGGHEH